MKTRFTLDGTAEQNELVRAIGSKNVQVSIEAQQALAAAAGPVIQKLLLTKGTVSAIYTDMPYNEDDAPSFPLDLYYGSTDGNIVVWSQSSNGGLASSQVTGNSEMKFMTYTLDSAVSFNKRYARKSRLDVVGGAIEHIINEVLIRQEKMGWSVILKAASEASTTPKGGSALKHVIRAATAGVFGIDDLSSLITRHVRLNESYSGNTPEGVYSNGPTDLYVSPEIKGQIRAFAYNPMNTRAGVLSGTSGAGYTSSVVALPEAMREEIYRNAGMQSIFGVNIVQLVEFGIGKKYNTLFDYYANLGSYTYTTGAGSGSAAFAGATTEIALAIDNSRGSYLRPIARGTENGGSTFNLLPDDQWNLARLDKAGFFGSLEEGRVCIDSRSTSGLIV